MPPQPARPIRHPKRVQPPQRRPTPLQIPEPGLPNTSKALQHKPDHARAVVGDVTQQAWRRRGRGGGGVEEGVDGAFVGESELAVGFPGPDGDCFLVLVLLGAWFSFYLQKWADTFETKPRSYDS